MTENKRFTYKHFDWLQWHIYKDGEFFIEVTNCEEDAKKLCELLNELAEEKKELQEKIEFAGLLANHRGEMVSFANALIQDLDDEKTQEMWENFKDEMYKEWKQKRGIE